LPGQKITKFKVLDDRQFSEHFGNVHFNQPAVDLVPGWYSCDIVKHRRMLVEGSGLHGANELKAPQIHVVFAESVYDVSIKY
jgi:hypothetical protein